jgi:hypothetical protein
MARMKCSFVLLFCALPLCGQSVSFGLKAGVPLTADLAGSDGRSVAGQRWTAGATVEFTLPLNLSVGVDALYRRFSYSYANDFGYSEDSKTGHWEFPVFAKYRFKSIVPPYVARPFAEGGFVFDRAHTSGTAQSFTGPPGCCGTITTTINSSQWGAGFLAGGGIEIKAAFLKIAPEVRYTRWQKGLFYDGFERNQVEVLVGVRF